MEQLKMGQEIIFTIKDKNYIYIVYPKHLSIKNLEYNDQIFKDLKLDKYKFFSNCYGYEPGVGSWPESKNEDYFALTKVVEALFPYCDEVTVNNKIVYSSSKKNLFIKSKSSDTSDFESIIQTTKIKLTFI